jgi:hypothetical protein
MASPLIVFLCAALALLLYGVMGLPLAARVAPRPLALMLAPALGWAVHSAFVLAVFFFIGMTRGTVILAYVLPLLIALLALRGQRKAAAAPLFDRWIVAALIAAALVAFAIAAAVLPKVSADGVALAAPIFDHSKIAIIDEMARNGVPPANPFYGGPGTPERLSYYYLWHFSAAELASLAHVSGWEADAALTWFTAFSSLALMIGFAVWLSERTSAGLIAVLLAATGSLRPLLYPLFGVDRAETVIGHQTGFAAWLFQTMWAPQHAMAAASAVLAIFLLVRLAQRPSFGTLIMVALAMTASFESSTWVGGVVLPLAAMPVALMLLAEARGRRWRLIFVFAASALLALLLILPFLLDQLHLAALRGGAMPIAIAPYEVLTQATGGVLGRLANLVAYWLIFLPVEFPAFYLAGLVALYVMLKRARAGERQQMLHAFAVLLLVSLGVGWLLVDTLANNNDLGWRAVLPAIMLLIVFAAAGLAQLAIKPLPRLAAPAALLVLLGLPDGLTLSYGNIVGEASPQNQAFASMPVLWRTVRQYASPTERVANNPLAMDKMTPWPVNIAWALLSNRRSCYASPDLVDPFTALPKFQRERSRSLFTRVFSGDGDADDVQELATRYRCSVAVLTPHDGAWTRDPFFASEYYRLVENNGAWRIYKLITVAER